MQFSYNYPSPSAFIQDEGRATVGLSPDLARSERVSFSGSLKHPLAFRDAMLALREVVVSDSKQKKKQREAFFAWLSQEVNRRTIAHSDFLGEERGRLSKDMVARYEKLGLANQNLKMLERRHHEVSHALGKFDVWQDYNALYYKFNEFLRIRDPSLYRALDPVISVQPGLVSFEAFSKDESIYGNLSVNYDEFDITGTPELGTTNIDFSAKLGQSIERFRSYNALELAIKPAGFVVDTGVTARHVEKKIEMPDSWVKGFTQVSSAAGLPGVEIDLPPGDVFTICTFLRRHKARKSPRATIWTLETGKAIKILFQPWNEEITLSTAYSGKTSHVEKIWGSRRWLILERLIPIASKFKLKLIGFGMPMFVVAYIGGMTITLGFTSWSSNDWARGTAFNILAGFAGNPAADVGAVLKRERVMSYEAIARKFPGLNEAQLKVAIGAVLRRGDGYFDIARGVFVYRQLSATPLPEYLHAPSPQERDVLDLVERIERKPTDAANRFTMDGEGMLHASMLLLTEKPPIKTDLLLNTDGQITKVKCICKAFQQGERNMSDPCVHLLFLFLKARAHVALPAVTGVVVEDVFSIEASQRVALGPKARVKKKPKVSRRRSRDDEDEDDGGNGGGEDDDDSEEDEP